MSLNGEPEDMITDKQLQTLISQIESENHQTNLVVTQFTSTVKDLSVRIEKLTEAQVDQSKQLLTMITESKGKEERNAIIFENIMKTQEKMANVLDNLGGRVAILENDNIETTTKVADLPSLHNRVKAIEISMVGFDSNAIDELDDRIDELELYVNTRKTINKFWSNHWFKIVGLIVPISLVIAYLYSEIKKVGG